MSQRDNGTPSRPRDGKRPNGRRRSGNGRGRGRPNAAAYRRKVEERLFGKKSDRTRLRLEERLRAAHGTPNFHRTFREYVKECGMPGDVGLLGMLLDLDSERDVLRVTEAIEDGLDGIGAEQRSLLRSRLRNLEMSTGSDAVADAAAELLDRL